MLIDKTHSRKSKSHNCEREHVAKQKLNSTDKSSLHGINHSDFIAMPKVNASAAKYSFYYRSVIQHLVIRIRNYYQTH